MRTEMVDDWTRWVNEYTGFESMVYLQNDRGGLRVACSLAKQAEAADDGGYGWCCDPDPSPPALIELEWPIVGCDVARRVHLPPAAAMQMLAIHDRNSLQVLAQVAVGAPQQGDGGGVPGWLRWIHASAWWKVYQRINIWTLTDYG